MPHCKEHNHTRASHDCSYMCPVAIHVTHISSVRSKVPSHDIVHKPIPIVINPVTRNFPVIGPCIAKQVWMTQIATCVHSGRSYAATCCAVPAF